MDRVRRPLYPRQNGLALALREYGRVERSIFMLNWIGDLDLRRRNQWVFLRCIEW